MSEGILRDNKTCQNCGNEIEVRFCTICGQENTETKKSFHYLFTHFLEDLVHYDSSFWKTIKYLLFSPEKLTLTYLSGKRKAFMAPVRLFIFINIISFIIFSAFTFKDIQQELNTEIVKNEREVKKQISGKNSLKDSQTIENIKTIETIEVNSNSSFFNQKLNELKEKNTTGQIIQKVLQKSFQNLPKWLFFIMPFFALILWFTHNKNKWWYFDHGIFTFHYFASFLLIASVMTIISQLVNLFGYETNDYYTIIIFIVLNFIFIKAFFKFYHESWIKSIFKLLAIYFLNSLIVLITFILFAMYIITIL